MIVPTTIDTVIDRKFIYNEKGEGIYLEGRKGISGLIYTDRYGNRYVNVVTGETCMRVSEDLEDTGEFLVYNSMADSLDALLK